MRRPEEEAGAPSLPPSPPPPLVVELRGLRSYASGENGLPRRRSYYWLLTYEGRVRRSAAFTLPAEGLCPTPLGAEAFRAEWGALASPAPPAPAPAAPPPSPPSSAAKRAKRPVLQVDLFETGPAASSSAAAAAAARGATPEQGLAGQSRAGGGARGEEEEEEGDEEEEEEGEEDGMFSIYDFNVLRVATAAVELDEGGPAAGWEAGRPASPSGAAAEERWYSFTSPRTGEVIWGLFVRVATWVGDGGEGKGHEPSAAVACAEVEEERTEQEEEDGEEEEEEDELTDDDTASLEIATGAGPTSSPPPSPLAQHRAAARRRRPRPGSEEPLRDAFGFPVAPHAAAEFRHLRSLEGLRAMEQCLRWDKIKCFRPSASAHRRRCHSAMASPMHHHPARPGIEEEDMLPVPDELRRGGSLNRGGGSSVSCNSSPVRSSLGSQHERVGTVDGATSLLGNGTSSSGSGSSGGGITVGAALKNLVWDGVPADLRDAVYQWLGGAQGKREVVGPLYYRRLAQASAEPALGLGGEGPEDAWVCVTQERGAVSEVSSHPDVGEAAASSGSSTRTSRASTPLAGLGGFGGTSNGLVMPELDAAWGGKVAQDIELDLGRAFADADAEVNTPEGRAKLRRVLRAYALRNPAVGYCQGMNFIAGLLLLVVPEETAFWALAHMVEEVSPLCFSPPLLGTRADMRALADLLAAELPALHQHCAALHLDLELLAGHWLLVYFVNVFPPPVALRVLEVAMAEGSDVTFAVALAFLRKIEAELLACDDLHELSQQIRRAQAAMYDADALLHAARAQLRTMRSRLRISRAWHLGDLIKLEQEQRGGGGGGTGGSAQSGGGRGAGSRGLVSRSEERMRLLMRRSLARGLSLVGLGFFVNPHTWRQWDRMAFQITHRLLLGEEGRLRSPRFAPVVVDLLSWWMNWPVLMRRTGELPAAAPAPGNTGPGMASSPPPSLGARSLSS